MPPEDELPEDDRVMGPDLDPPKEEPLKDLSWSDVGKDFLDLIKGEFEPLAEEAKEEAQEKIKLIAAEGIKYMKWKLEGGEKAEEADKNLEFLQHEARSIALRYSIKASAALERTLVVALQFGLKTIARVAGIPLPIA